MAEDITLRVITPDRIVVDTTASAVRIPGLDGSIGILRNHAPMIAALDVGLLRLRHAGRAQVLFVAGGFADVRNNTVRVVSESGERSDDIDVERAKAAEERARKRLEEGGRGGDVDVLRAELALSRALARLQARVQSLAL